MMDDRKVVYSSISSIDEAHYAFIGKCGKYEFELDVELVPFPDEKTRDTAYRVWVETFVRNRII